MFNKIIIILVFSFPSVALAAPAIMSITGVISDGMQVTVTGGGFGDNGPNVILFDNFSKGTSGGKLPVAATIGVWEKMASTAFPDPLLSNGQGARCFDNTGWLNANLLKFNQMYSEVFVSSIGYVPSGYFFPSTTSEKTLPSRSALKHHWLYYSSTGYKTDNDPDLVGTCLNSPTSTYNLFANDYARATLDRDMDWQWVFSEPVRWTLWVKGNGNKISGSDGLYQAVSSAGQRYKRYTDQFAWFRNDDSVYGFDRLTVPGYLYGAGDPKANYVVDDVYVAVGPNAAARVELGNSAIYTNCTKLAISTPDVWSDTKIKVTIREGGFKSGDQVYLFVVRGNGEYSSGYGPFSMGQDVADKETVIPRTVQGFKNL